MIEKILNEISRLKGELDGYSALEALDYIEAYINTLPEEPIVKGITWKDVNTLDTLINQVRYEFPNGIGEKSFGMAVLEKFQDYQDDIEKPTSEDLEKEIEEEIDNLCELGCYMEDLAKGDSEGVYPLPDNVVKELRKFARHFAEWQENKDKQSLIDNGTVLLTEDEFEKLKRSIIQSEKDKHKMKVILQTEYEKGRFDMREEMMKDAIECIVEDWCGDSPEITIPLNPQDFKTGDKVKIILVKTEQQ